jgi:ADP-ribose pyrophosphatase YjhB (NUDIX family)
MLSLQPLFHLMRRYEMTLRAAGAKLDAPIPDEVLLDDHVSEAATDLASQVDRATGFLWPEMLASPKTPVWAVLGNMIASDRMLREQLVRYGQGELVAKLLERADVPVRMPGDWSAVRRNFSRNVPVRPGGAATYVEVGSLCDSRYCESCGDGAVSSELREVQENIERLATEGVKRVVLVDRGMTDAIFFSLVDSARRADMEVGLRTNDPMRFSLAAVPRLACIEYVLPVPPLDSMQRPPAVRFSEAGSYSLPICLAFLADISSDVEVQYEVVVNRQNSADVRHLPELVTNSGSNPAALRLMRSDPVAMSHGYPELIGTATWLNDAEFKSVLDAVGAEWPQAPERLNIQGPSGIRRHVASDAGRLQTTFASRASRNSLPGATAAGIVTPQRASVPMDVQILLFNKAGEVLLGRRSTRMPWAPGFYGPPTSHLLQGETPMDGVIRTFLKETNRDFDPQYLRLRVVMLDHGDIQFGGPEQVGDPRFRSDPRLRHFYVYGRPVERGDDLLTWLRRDFDKFNAYPMHSLPWNSLPYLRYGLNALAQNTSNNAIWVERGEPHLIDSSASIDLRMG